MKKGYTILALIPARSGSKGIKNKNIKMFCNKPLIYWSIQQAIDCRYNMRIVVSTDSEEYANISRESGSEVPFLRPPELSGDLSTDHDFIKHALDWLKDNENYVPDIIVQLRPTQPCRKVETLNRCLDLFISHYDKYDSLRTVYKIDKSPYKMYTVEGGKECEDDKNYNTSPLLCPLFQEVNGISEPYNQCRQVLPQCYLHNGYVDILKSRIVTEHNTISGSRIYPFIMEKNDLIDIDTYADWSHAEKNFINKSYEHTPNLTKQ